MKSYSIILDHLSNWYVRRNRRRFWKSESDNDKNAAYLTLYNSLMIYIKVLAPIIPFLTEEMHKNLSNASDSIHLSSFPEYDKNKTDFDLIKEIDDVINIVGINRDYNYFEFQDSLIDKNASKCMKINFCLIFQIAK